ncbi:MAG: SGNH/GDSL hydrolase family protein [Candidatus Aureabacteria bacterium]|nr:SGNH/GDSL hydrolase family protein [Candidatus Auribacterota bacterium]
MKKHHPLDAKVTLVGASVLLTLVLLEILLRIPSWFPPFPDCIPNPSAYRIICIGDSSTFGHGTSDRNRFSYPAQLQSLLDAHNKKPIQIFNLGLPGINSSQGYHILAKEIGRLSPHLILVCVGMNDAWNWEESRLLEEYESKFFDKIKRDMLLFFNSLKLVRFFKLIKLTKEWVPSFTKETIQNNHDLLPDEQKRRKALYACLKNNLLDFKKLADSNKARILFIEYHAPGWNDPQILIHQLYRSLDLNFIETADFFSLADGLNLPIRSRDGWHLNDYGYRLWVRLICNGLHGKIPIEIPHFTLTKKSLWNAKKIKKQHERKSVTKPLSN